MAKANITTKDGATISIEGTAAEVAEMLSRFHSPSADGAGDGNAKIKRRSSGKAKAKATTGGKKKITATTLIAEMISDGFFKKPKELADIQAALKQGGHYFSQSGVATPLLRAVKARNLRRLDGEKGWTYVI